MSQERSAVDLNVPALYGLADWFVTGDHKKIGIMYLWFALFIIWQARIYEL
ncbi:MAG: hypothetical protein V1794_12505 [Candidatus Glassbacteria bacterium]